VHPAGIAAGAPAARERAAQPVARALLPQWLARLVGLAALGAVGALEWQRQIAGYGSARALTWVLGALVAAGLVLAACRLPAGWRRAGGLAAAVLLAVAAGYLLSGAPLHYAKPRHWDELFTTVGDGLQALGTVRLPYKSASPAPRIALEVLAGGLLVLAGLATFWPRAQRGEELRGTARGPERGYQFVALAVLLVVAISPVVSVGGKRSLALGLGLSAITVAFLWLERLPLRPGLGVAALVGVALAGALPLASLADRGEPWFDYQSFAENLGPDDPVHFSWAQTYGPMTWPRDGNEVMRVTSARPLYWKARDLDVFDGGAWRIRTDPTPAAHLSTARWRADLAPGWAQQQAWTSTISFDVRRMKGTDVVGAGTIVQVKNPSRGVRPGVAAGTWDSVGALHRGDSYTLKVHTPRPGPALLEAATTGAGVPDAGELQITVPFKPGRFAPGVFIRLQRRRVHRAVVHFKGFDDRNGVSYVSYPRASQADYDLDRVMQRTVYARTWALAERLRKGAKTPYQYVLAVNAYLHGRGFVYDERPPQAPRGVPPLDYFLNVSHKGYCQHYAGAMALLLRMGGVPARVATGFSPGGFSSQHNQWIVRDTDAHAWVEAWFDRYGWVTFDPTPAATPARSQIFAISAPNARTGDTPTARATPGADNGASSRDPEGGTNPDRLRQLQLQQTNGASGAGGELSRLWWLVAIVLLVGGVLGAWLKAVLRAPRAGTPMDRAVAELETALRILGRPVKTGTTLSQLERRLGSYSPEVRAYFQWLSAGRYGPGAPAPDRGGRRALRRALAAGLGPLGRLRALWALPPRVSRRDRPAVDPTGAETFVSVRR
jgi:protein-glutamine gamma-glutamyltransferase